MGLVVPVSAAVLDTTSAAPVSEVAAASTASAGSAFFVHGAPQPLLVMALGALVVLIPVTRRARRVGARIPSSSVEAAQG